MTSPPSPEPEPPPSTAIIGTVDSHGRALTKAVTWRVIGTADTFLWSWLITQQPMAAGAIAGSEVVTKIVLFYVHERLWRLIRIAPNSRVRSLVKAIAVSYTHLDVYKRQ